MIYEVRTYTLKPGSVAKFEENFGKALPARQKYSKLEHFPHGSGLVGIGSHLIYVAQGLVFAQGTHEWSGVPDLRLLGHVHVGGVGRRPFGVLGSVGADIVTLFHALVGPNVDDLV